MEPGQWLDGDDLVVHDHNIFPGSRPPSRLQHLNQEYVLDTNVPDMKHQDQSKATTAWTATYVRSDKLLPGRQSHPPRRRSPIT